MIKNPRKAPWISIVGGHNANPETEKLAEEVGKLLAEKGAVIVCGGLGGVMEAVARGAKNAGGTVIGILPGSSREKANEYIDYPIPTGLGHARNSIVPLVGDAVIAIDGSWGTLSEISFAQIYGKTVVGLASFEIKGVKQAKTPKEAVEIALKSVKAYKSGK